MLKRLLKKEERTVEIINVLDFEINECNDDYRRGELIAYQTKLSRLRKKIIKELKRELEWRE